MALITNTNNIANQTTKKVPVGSTNQTITLTTNIPKYLSQLGISQIQVPVSSTKNTSLITTSYSDRVTLSRQFNRNTRNVASIANTANFGTFLNDLLKPVSSFVGSTLAVPLMMSNPLGAVSLLPRSVAALVEQVNPQFAAAMEATFIKYHIDAIFNMPSQLLGSISTLLQTVESALTYPLLLAQDLYEGAMNQIEQLSNKLNELINQILNDFFTTVLGWLDELLGIGEILAFIEELGTLASFIGVAVGVFQGDNAILNFGLQVLNISNGVNAVLQDPAALLMAYAPWQVTAALYILRNPRQIIESLIPDELLGLLNAANGRTGFGFSGNLGYGFGAALYGVRGTALSSILANFSQQYPVLTAVLGLITSLTDTNDRNSNNLSTSKVNPRQKTAAGGFVQPQGVPNPVFPYIGP
jgi:hypothetical protein